MVSSCVTMKLQNEPKALGPNFSTLHLGNQRARLPQQFTELPPLSNGLTGIVAVPSGLLVATRSHPTPVLCQW